MIDNNNSKALDSMFESDPFADVTVDSLAGIPAEQEEDLVEDEIVNDESPVEEINEEVEEDVDNEESENEEEASPGEESEKKVQGIAEVRKAYERASAREKQLTDEVTSVNSVFEDLGADAKTIADVVKDYGGIEQLKVGTQIYKLVTDNAGDTEALLRQAKDIIPETVENLVLYVASEVEKDFASEYQQRLFGRNLTAEEIVNVRDFLDFGTVSHSDIPKEMLEDDFGAPLPEKTQAAVKALWERNKSADRRLADLTHRIDQKVNSIESNTVTRMRDEYMGNSFKAMLEVGKTLGLDRAPSNQEEKAQMSLDAAALETLTFKFFSMNPAADRALSQALETLGKNDATSKAKHADATRQVTKFAKIAAEKAATYLAPQTRVKADKISTESEQRGAKEAIKTSTKATPASGRKEQLADDWSDLTVDTLKLNKRGRR